MSIKFSELKDGTFIKFLRFPEDLKTRYSDDITNTTEKPFLDIQEAGEIKGDRIIFPSISIFYNKNQEYIEGECFKLMKLTKIDFESNLYKSKKYMCKVTSIGEETLILEIYLKEDNSHLFTMKIEVKSKIPLEKRKLLWDYGFEMCNYKVVRCGDKYVFFKNETDEDKYHIDSIELTHSLLISRGVYNDTNFNEYLSSYTTTLLNY